MTRPVDHAWSRAWAEKLLAIDPAAEHISDDSENNLARAYLSLLEAVEPLLAAAGDMDGNYEMEDHGFVVAARNTAAALRDLLGAER